MRKNKIGLIIPKHFDIYKVFVKNLEDIGFSVPFVFLSDTPFKYKSWFERGKNLFQKTVLRNKNYKNFLRTQKHSRELKNEISKVNEKLDYILVIRPDYFCIDSIKLLKSHCHKLVAYQWDGFDRYPHIISYVELFDRFLAFDKRDYLKLKQQFTNLKFTTNFYFDLELNSPKINPEAQKSVFFLGSYIPNRNRHILKLSSFFEKMNLKQNIQLYHSSQEEKFLGSKTHIQIIKTSYSYITVLELIQKHDVLLEFHNNDIHCGLSFRVFEALCFEKKLITNNHEVLNYDFYHPNNIFVWTNDNLDKLDEFITKPYMPIAPEVKEKYGFTNWIKYALDMPEHQKIELQKVPYSIHN